MSRKTKISGLMVVALMVLTVPLVYADNGPATLTTGASTPATGGGEDKESVRQDGDWIHGDKGPMMAKILNLSDDQAKQLNDLQEKQKASMKNLFEQVKTNREALEAEIVKATPDMGKVNDIETQFKTLQSQMVDNHLNSLLEVKKTMSPEQFAGYMALKKERMMMEHMMGHGKFGHKDGYGKDGERHKHGAEKQDPGHFSEDED